MKTGFNANNGFCVKRRVVCIKKEHQECQDIDLSGYQTIKDVVDKLKGSGAYHGSELLKGDEIVDQFIIRTPNNRYVFITMPCDAPAQFVLSQSVSSAASKDEGIEIFRKTVDYPVHFHYLAIEIHNKWADKDGVDDIVTNFQNILSFNGDQNLLSDEELYTSLLSRELDTFLSPAYGCVHQITMRHSKKSSTSSKSLPDFYCASMWQEGIPAIPVLAADFKIKSTDYRTALAESFGYCLDVVHNTKSFRPIITIPGTKEKFALYLCFGIGGEAPKLVTIKIGEAMVNDRIEMSCFFSALKFAVQHVANAANTMSFVVEPWSGLTLQLPLNSSFLNHDDKNVYKFYDENHITPKTDVISKIDPNYFRMERV